MKKICILVCCILMTQMLCACNTRPEDYQQPTNFYFSSKDVSYNSPMGVIQPEVREGADLHGNLTAFLHAYLRGPKSQDLVRVIPSEVYLVSCDITDKTANIVFSTQFSNLKDIDLIYACSALLMSIHDFIGADTLSISAKDAMIDENCTFTITMNDIVWMDTVTIEE